MVSVMANDSVSFSLTGMDDLLNKFSAIDDDLKRRGGRFALRKAASLVAEKAKEKAALIDDPATGRSIADNIAVRWNGRLFRRNGDLGFRVGVLKGAKLADGGDLSPLSPTPHWRLIEFGTQHVRAQPFMRNSLSENISAAINEFSIHYEKSIDRALRRAVKQG